jgi:hypothetical protein
MEKATVDSVMALAKAYGNALGCSATDTRELKGVLRAEVERLAAQAEPAPAPVGEYPAKAQPHEWPGEWSKTAPQVADHPPGAELVWAVRGEPFTRPILARSNVGARIQRFASKGERFVYVELMAEGFHGVHAGHYGFFESLEWRGPLVLPSAMHTASTDQDMKGGV